MVNAINACSNRPRKKSRGRGENKREWYIEDNEAHKLYLNTYGYVNTINSMITATHVNNRPWKYWHNGKNHGNAMAIIVAYGLYLECPSGELNPEWKIVRPDSLWQFQNKLAE